MNPTPLRPAHVAKAITAALVPILVAVITGLLDRLPDTPIGEPWATLITSVAAAVAVYRVPNRPPDSPAP